MKRLLAAIGCLLASSAHAVDLPGTYITRNNPCDPYGLQPDFIYSGTWGKRAAPRHCATISQRNPAFMWTRPAGVADNVPATLTVNGSYYDPDTKSTKNYSRDVKDLTDPRFLFDEALPDGDYTWSVTYGTGYTSATRHFRVRGTHTIPSGEYIAQKAAEHSRPRALPTGSSYAAILATVSNSDLQGPYGVTVAEAGKFQRKVAGYEIPAEPVSTESTKSIRDKALNERRAIELLGHMYFFTKDNNYLAACRERLLKLAAWSTKDDAPSSEAKQDQANREIFLTMAIGLDLFSASPQPLSAEERGLVLGSMIARIDQARTSVKKDLDYHPYYSHPLTAAHYLVEALMYAQGLPEYPKASEHLQEAWRDLITSIGAWGGTSDGGYGNGTAYNWYSVNEMSRTLAALRLIVGFDPATDYDMTKFPPLGLYGRSLIAQTNPGPGILAIFGDGVEDDSLFWNHSRTALRLLALVTKNPEYEWYWRSRNLAPNVVLSPYNFLLAAYGVPAAPKAEQITLPNAFLFEDAGYVAFHSDTKKGDRSSLFFRSSQLGAENHSHADNNSFNFISKGKEIFISSGFYKDYTGDHEKVWTMQTRSKNALTFDCGIGQALQGFASSTCDDIPWKDQPTTVVRSTDASGKLVNYYDENGWMIATGDATNAYRSLTGNTWTPLLDEAYRTVVYRKDDGVAIVFDYARSTVPRTWELNYHTLVPPNAANNRMQITRDNIPSVCADLHGPAGAFLPTLEEFPDYVPPSTGVKEYHARWKAQQASNEFAAVTLISEGCTVRLVPTTLSNSSIRVDFNGKSITFDKNKVHFE